MMSTMWAVLRRIVEKHPSPKRRRFAEGVLSQCEHLEPRINLTPTAIHAEVRLLPSESIEVWEVNFSDWKILEQQDGQRGRVHASLNGIATNSQIENKSDDDDQTERTAIKVFVDLVRESVSGASPAYGRVLPDDSGDVILRDLLFRQFAVTPGNPQTGLPAPGKPDLESWTHLLGANPLSGCLPLSSRNATSSQPVQIASLDRNDLNGTGAGAGSSWLRDFGQIGTSVNRETLGHSLQQSSIVSVLDWDNGDVSVARLNEMDVVDITSAERSESLAADAMAVPSAASPPATSPQTSTAVSTASHVPDPEMVNALNDMFVGHSADFGHQLDIMYGNRWQPGETGNDSSDGGDTENDRPQPVSVALVGAIGVWLVSAGLGYRLLSEKGVISQIIRDEATGNRDSTSGRQCDD